MTTELPTNVAESLRSRAERVAVVVKKPPEQLIETARQVYTDLIEKGKSTNEAEGALDAVFAVDKKELATARRANLRTLMDQKQLSPKALVEKMILPDDERSKWIQYIYNIRSDNEQTTVTPDRAEKLAPVLGVQIMDLLIDYTDRERNRLNGSTESPTPTSRKREVVSTMTPNELKIRRGEALNLFMEQNQLSANQLALKIESDEYQASLLAMKIAESRQGEEILPADTLTKIAGKFQVEPASLYIELSPDEQAAIPESDAAPDTESASSPQTGSQDANTAPREKRPYKRRTTTTPSVPEQGTKQPQPKAEVAVAATDKEIARITLSASEFQQRMGFVLSIVQGADGRYIARMPEKKLSKDEVIQLLAQQIGK